MLPHKSQQLNSAKIEFFNYFLLKENFESFSVWTVINYCQKTHISLEREKYKFSILNLVKNKYNFVKIY